MVHVYFSLPLSLSPSLPTSLLSPSSLPPPPSLLPSLLPPPSSPHSPHSPHTLPLRGNIGALRLLLPRLPAMCTVNDQKDDGFTALHLAALNNHLEASQALLQAVSGDTLIRTLWICVLISEVS